MRIKYEDLINTQFDGTQLTLLKILEKRIRTENKIGLFRCSCGAEKEIRICEVKRKHTKTCGCINHLKGKEDRNWKGHGDISGQFWTQIQTQIKNKNITFNITIEEAWNIFLNQEGRCALTGMPLYLSLEDNTKIRNGSLDRIDSDGIYEISNVHWVHKDIYLMKGKFPLEDFKYLCRIVTEYNSELCKQIS